LLNLLNLNVNMNLKNELGTELITICVLTQKINFVELASSVHEFSTI